MRHAMLRCYVNEMCYVTEMCWYVMLMRCAMLVRCDMCYVNEMCHVSEMCYDMCYVNEMCYVKKIIIAKRQCWCVIKGNVLRGRPWDVTRHDVQYSRRMVCLIWFVKFCFDSRHVQIIAIIIIVVTRNCSYFLLHIP